MIFISNKKDPNSIIILKNSDDAGPFFNIKIFNPTYKWEDEVMDHSQYKNFFVFDIDFSKFLDGEYTYQLFNLDGDIIGSGLISIGLDYKHQYVKEYK